MDRRVVVTGVGVISPVGLDATSSWANVLEGISGVSWLTQVDAAKHGVKIAGEVKNWDITKRLPAKELRRRDRYQLLSYFAIHEALEQAGYDPNQIDPRRAGIIFGCTMGGMVSIIEQLRLIDEQGMGKINPFSVLRFMTTTGGSATSVDLNLQGVSYNVTSACATGNDCIGHAYDQIRLGRADMMIAGAGDAPIADTIVAAFDRMGTCSSETVNPARAMRPFARDRNGLVIAEGSGAVILESLEHAQKRGATILAELSGYGSTSDGFSLVAPEPEGRGAVGAMQNALNDAELNPTDISYINAHGTATPLNDVMETRAIKRVFGDYAYQLPVSSTKSVTGHAMGATGAMEAVFAVLALRDQIAPPTINLEEPDPECDLDYVPGEARQIKIEHIMSNSFGFGGHNATLIFSKFR